MTTSFGASPDDRPGSTSDGSPPRRRTIAVFCGSSSGFDDAYRSAATALGTEIAESGHDLVYGGGDVGLMGAVADGVLAGGADAVGVITEHLHELELGHNGLTALEVVVDMHTRKARMLELADGVVVLPGGFGTYEEAFEILTWNQLGIASLPVVFLDVLVGGVSFFDPLFEFVRGAVDAGFMKPDHGRLAQRATGAAAAVALACAAPPPFTRKWVG